MDRFGVRIALASIAVMALLVSACGGDSADEEAAATTVASALGGDDDGDAAAAATTAAAAESDDTGGSDVAEQEEGESAAGDLSLVPAGETDILGNPAGQGSVELDGVRYDFVLNAACQKIFGAVQASGLAADGSESRVDAIIPPEDWETDTAAGWDPPYVEIEIGDDSWRAEAGSQHLAAGENVDLTPEQSSVGSFTNDGSLVAGTAVFFSAYNYDEVETVTGSFEFYCP
jgi:hypothetical protein